MTAPYHAIINSRLFDGEAFCDSKSIIINGSKIERICPSELLPNDIDIVDCSNQIIAPGFVDTQINGAADVLFNDAPTETTIKHISDSQRCFGTTSFLPTLISPSRELIIQARIAAEAATKSTDNGCVGIHIEGPFLNPQKRGVHPKEQIIPFQDSDVALFSNNPMLTLMTVAPEAVSADHIHALQQAGLIINLGHSNASVDETMKALEAGASGFTHLFNAMSPLNSREPGMVGAALLSANAWCGIILDGHHIHPQSAQLAINCKQPGKVFYVTDAVHACDSDNRSLTLLGQEIINENGKVSTSEGTLAGSNLTMIDAVRNGFHWLDLSLEESLKMASRYPAEFLGLDNEIGFIKPGFNASLVAFDEHLNITHSWVNGHHQQHNG